MMHTDDINVLVLMGLARDAAEVESRNCYDVIERLRGAIEYELRRARECQDWPAVERMTEALALKEGE